MMTKSGDDDESICVRIIYQSEQRCKEKMDNKIILKVCRRRRRHVAIVELNSLDP